jgi:hypothetical protein
MLKIKYVINICLFLKRKNFLFSTNTLSVSNKILMNKHDDLQGIGVIVWKMLSIPECSRKF